MPEVHVYEPALCCTTGVCGPELDQSLVTFTADVAHVNDAGGRVRRHNLANDPQSFVQDPSVTAFLHVAGSEGLPLTIVDGVTVLTGTYPTREQLRRFADVGEPAMPKPLGLSLIPIGSPVGETCSPDSPSGCC